MANWREILPHTPGRLILDIVAFTGHLVRLEREDGLPRIVIRRLADGVEHAIAFDEEAYALGMSAGYEFDTTTIRFIYSSMTTPAADVRLRHGHARTRTLRKTPGSPERPRPGRLRHAPSACARRRTAQTVPVSILYRKDTPLDGSAPLFLYGYGAYGISIPASFSTTRLSLVDRGFIFAIAHIRGGKDKGYHWYTDGKLENKVNTFTDFIAAGEYPRRGGLRSRGPHRRQRRLGRRHADGRRRQHGARPVPRHHRRRAVRRRAQHHAATRTCR